MPRPAEYRRSKTRHWAEQGDSQHSRTHQQGDGSTEAPCCVTCYDPEAEWQHQRFVDVTLLRVSFDSRWWIKWRMSPLDHGRAWQTPLGPPLSFANIVALTATSTQSWRIPASPTPLRCKVTGTKMMNIKISATTLLMRENHGICSSGGWTKIQRRMISRLTSRRMGSALPSCVN